LKLDIIYNCQLQIEQDLIHLLNGLMKKVFGKGSSKMELRIFGNMILVKAEGILTSSERFILNNSEAEAELIKDYKYRVLKAGRDFIQQEISSYLGTMELMDIYFDLNVVKDEAVLVLMLDGNLEEKLNRR